jgi:hypothetical protein
LRPPYGPDSRTVERLAGPVDAAKLLDGGIIDELIAAVRGIVTGLPPAPPDYLKISPLLDGLRKGLHQYEESPNRGRTPRGTLRVHSRPPLDKPCGLSMVRPRPAVSAGYAPASSAPAGDQRQIGGAHPRQQSDAALPFTTAATLVRALARW